MNQNLILYSDTQVEDVQEFIRGHFGDSRFLSHELESEYVHTDTMLISPQEQGLTCVTCGMGARKMNSPSDVKRIELAISASAAVDPTSEDAFWLAGEVTHLSKFPFREDTWLEANHTIGASPDFQERFGYDYFALWDLDLHFQPTDMDDEVHFFALVPLYEEEREWIVNNHTFPLLLHLHNLYGDAMFCADLPREVCIPDWDEDEQEMQVMRHVLGLDEDAMATLLERMAEAEENDEEVTFEQLDAWVQELKNAQNLQE